MKHRTKQFAIDIIHFCDNLPKSPACRSITFQLIRSATSTGANYRAACRGRSKAEFYAKISITVEEADESLYWLEVIKGTEIICNKDELTRLEAEISEIVAIVSKARKSASRGKKWVNEWMIEWVNRKIRQLFYHSLILSFYHSFILNCEGVIPVNFLKAVLKEDLELKPTSYIISAIVWRESRGLRIINLAASTLCWLI